MKIINFNRRNKADNTRLLDTYIDWNKQYCYDLSRKITSLYDYMMWNYPEYLIFNAPNSLSGSENFEPYRSLVDTDEEPRLVQPYERHIKILNAKTSTSTTSILENKSIFFPSRLNFHQGFYNQSTYGDGYLVELSDWQRGDKKCYHMSGFYYLYPEDDDEGEYRWIRYKIIDVPSNGPIYLDAAFDTLCGQSSEDLKWNSLVQYDDYTLDFNFDIHRQELTINNPSKYLALELGYYEDAPINFPSGYICVLNKQPTGLNNEQNPIKNDLSNYLIAPMGNGGYYDIWWNNNVLQADYKANELNNFSSKITINLAQNCRYINPSNDTFSFTKQKLNVTILNWHINNDEVKPQLSDKHNNIWTGQEDLVAQPYFNGEKMFTDIQYDSFRSVIKQQNVHNFNAHVDEPFSLTKVNLLIY